MAAIRKNTALTGFLFVMYDSGGAPKTGLTVTGQRSLDGAAFAATANSPTEVGSGVYAITLAAADLNGDVVGLRFTAAGADATNITLFPDGDAFDLNAYSSGDHSIIAAGSDVLAFATADAVFFAPFRVRRRFVASRMFAMNGAIAAGNTRLGIYDKDRALLASTPATAMSGTDVEQVISLSASVTLAPGLYFMALSNSGTTGQYVFFRILGGTGASHVVGFRAAASGGIITLPTIVDISSSIFAVMDRVPFFGVLGFASNELVTT